MSRAPQRVYSRRPSLSGESAGARGTPSTHKYKVGQKVRYLRSPAARLSREMEKSVFAASFEVKLLLPVSGAEFQYRLRNMATGQERIAAETEILPIEAA